MSVPRLALAACAAVLLVGLAAWSVGPGTVEGPARVEAGRSFEVVHTGDGRVRWSVRDGTVPGGPALSRDGVVQPDRGVPVEVVRAEGLAPGARVEADVLLATVRSAGQSAEADSLAAEVAALEADLALVEAGGRPEVVQRAGQAIDVAQAALAQAEAALAQAETLAASGAAGSWEVELARQEVAIRTAERDLARAQLQEARQPARTEERAVLEARISVARARLQAAQARVEGHALHSPFAGTLQVDGSDAVLSVIADGPRCLQLAVPEKDAGRVAVDSPVVFTPTTGAPPVTGRVQAVGTRAEPMAGRTVVWVVAELDTASAAASPAVGATGTAVIETGGWW